MKQNFRTIFEDHFGGAWHDDPTVWPALPSHRLRSWFDVRIHSMGADIRDLSLITDKQDAGQHTPTFRRVLLRIDWPSGSVPVNEGSLAG